MSYSELQGLLGIGSIIGFILIIIVYASLAKRAKSFSVNLDSSIDEIYQILIAMPGYVVNHKVKNIEHSGKDTLKLVGSIIKTAITKSSGGFNCVWKLRWFISYPIALVFCTFGFTGIDMLLRGRGGDSFIYFVIAIAVHIARGMILKRGRNTIVSLEEYISSFSNP